MKRNWTITLMLLAVLVLIGLFLKQQSLRIEEVPKAEAMFEVWAMDQSDTDPEGGGLLYIWEGESISENAAERPKRISSIWHRSQEPQTAKSLSGLTWR